jgi:16S rRNA (uracil1498-N3)-methyltransferase
MGDERGQRLVGVTRETAPPALDQWLRHQADPVQLTWLMVGPEGGWTEEELKQFTQAQIQPVQMGSTILRSSTAAVAGAVELVRWRDRLISS